MKRTATIAVVAAACVITAIVAFYKHPEGCAPGFRRQGPRCLVVDCPLARTDHGCDEAEHDVVAIPALSVLIGPADWEAEGRVKPQTLSVAAFAIDRLEVSAGRFCRWKKAPCDDDPARAASNVALTDARAFCTDHGGRLPTDAEWTAAAAGDKPRRYPWGDTGAVCRRAAWGLAGQCASGGDGPDTVGAHPDGATPLGVHDLAGNVGEWVEAGAGKGWTRGGSWKTNLATDLRTWPHEEPKETGDATTGFRCAYDPVRSSIP